MSGSAEITEANDIEQGVYQGLDPLKLKLLKPADGEVVLKDPHLQRTYTGIEIVVGVPPPPATFRRVFERKTNRFDHILGCLLGVALALGVYGLFAGWYA